MKVLFLSQRVPFPPNRGDKITTWRLLERMARHHDVTVAAFAHDQADEEGALEPPPRALSSAPSSSASARPGRVPASKPGTASSSGPSTAGPHSAQRKRRPALPHAKAMRTSPAPNASLHLLHLPRFAGDRSTLCSRTVNQ